MPRNGSGTYTLPSGNPVSTGTLISSTTHNNTNDDIAAALTGSLARDGQTTPTANIPMGGFRLTGLGAATATTDAARVDQVQNSSLTYLTSVAGTDTITATCAPTPTLTAGQIFRFIPAATNTGATTLNISGLGAKNVYFNGAALVGGEILANVPVQVMYDGTQFNLLNEVPGIVLLSSASASSSATVEFISKITSAFDSYKVELVSVSPATTNTELHLQTSTDNGSSWTAGTSYIYARGINLATTAFTFSGNGSTGDSKIALAAALSSTPSNGIKVSIDFDTSSNQFIWSGGYYLNGDADYVNIVGGNGRAVTAPINAIRFSMSSGNIASGTFRLYGVRK